MKKLILLLLFLLPACSGVPKSPRGFEMRLAQTEHFSVPVWEKTPIQSKCSIRFYISGNGAPTPDKPVALMLAARDPNQNVVVLSRPCQYSKDKMCAKSEVYGVSQYSAEVLSEIKEMVVYYVRQYNAPSIDFVAYDGGAPVALYLASELPNVRKIVTIAGILDLDTYVNKNNLTDFDNPIDLTKLVTKLDRIPQVHFVGGKDEITTRGMAERFVSKLSNPRSAVVKVAPNMGHTGWEKIDLAY